MIQTQARHELHPRAGRQLTWLLILCTLPFLFEMPAWVPVSAAVFLGWRYLYDRHNFSLPSRLVRYGLVAVISALTVSKHGTLSGYEPATTMLILLGGLKLLETVKQRDSYSIVLISWVLAGMLQLYDQTTFNLLVGLAIIVTSIVSLSILHDTQDSGVNLLAIVRGVLKLFVLGLPVGILIFVVFPRLSIQHLGIGFGMDPKAQTGFSDSIDPGSVSEIVLSDTVAMRVKFPNAPPPRNVDLYWRGAVMEHSNGLKWQRERNEPTNAMTAPSDGIEQLITLEPQTGRWLFGLDMPSHAEFVTLTRNRIRLESNGVLTPTSVPTSRIVYRVLSSKTPPQIGELDKKTFARWTKVSQAQRWPKTLELAQKLRHESASADAIVQNILRKFKDEDFRYSLQPGVIPEDSVDYFLFIHKKGFCEHYAAATATLLRLAGVPARVVAGFQGGVYNKIGEFLVVKGRDAHSWVEYHTPERGWVRVDPVTVVAPDRIQLGAETYFNNEQIGFVTQGFLGGVFKRGTLLGRKLWAAVSAYEAFDFRVTQFLLEFDINFQNELLANWGILTHQKAILWSAVLVILVAAFLFFYWISWRKSRTRDEMLVLLGRARKKLARQGVNVDPWEAPATILRKIQLQKPELLSEWKDWLESWSQERYGPPATNHARRVYWLRKALMQHVRPR